MTAADCRGYEGREAFRLGPGRSSFFYVCVLFAATGSLSRRHSDSALHPWVVIRKAPRLDGGNELAGQVKKAIAGIDPDLPVTAVMSMEDAISDSIGDYRLYMHERCGSTQSWRYATNKKGCLLRRVAGSPAAEPTTDPKRDLRIHPLPGAPPSVWEGGVLVFLYGHSQVVECRRPNQGLS